MILTGLSILIGIIALFPFIISICLLLFYRQVGRKPTIRKIADYTTPFLFLSVYLIAHTIFGDGVGYIIALTAVTIVLIFAVYERKRVKDFEIMYLLRKAWRVFFILLLIVYILLLIVGLILTIIDHFA